MATAKKLPSGNYRVRAFLGRDETGKKKYKSFTGPDRRRVLLLAAEYADQHRAAHDGSSFSSALEAYICSREAVLSYSTIRGYRNIQKVLLRECAAFCELPVHKISHEDIQQLVNTLVKNGTSAKTIRNYTGLISAAMRSKGYAAPPASLPQRTRTEYRIPTFDEVRMLLKAAAGTRLEIPIELAIYGLRRGEICALKLSDLSDDNVVHIHASIAYDEKGKTHVKAPKTYNSDRYVPISDSLAAKIRAAGMITDYEPQSLSHAFRRFLAKQDVEHFRFHDLRHFFVSYCHTVLRLSDAQIQKLGGWKTNSVMRTVYLQSMEDTAAAEAVTKAFSSL